MKEKRKHNRLQLSGELLLKQLGGRGDSETAHIEIHDCSYGIGYRTSYQVADS